jgi:hypothetical protein
VKAGAWIGESLILTVEVNHATKH